MMEVLKDAARDAVTQAIQDVWHLPVAGGARTELEQAITTRLLERGIEFRVSPTGEPSDDNILRHCGALPGDDWVKRVERLNAEIDALKVEASEA